MVRAVLRKGAIVPMEALPDQWQDGTALEIVLSEPLVPDIDAWAAFMKQLCADSAPSDEEVMRQAIEAQRQEAKAQTRREMGLPA